MKIMLERRGIAVRVEGGTLVNMDARLSAWAVTENASSAANRKRFNFMVNFDSGSRAAFKAILFSWFISRAPAKFRLQRDFRRHNETRNRLQNHPDEKQLRSEEHTS